TVTVKNLLVAEVVPEKHLLLVKGAVPGWPNGWVMVYFK
ncbi:MAG: 50S ribosomal protein L3, partial [Thermodesulfatator sp.]